MSVALATAAALSIAAACAPSVDAHMMAGIARHESGLRPLAIHDNSTGESVFPDDKAAAIHTAESLIGQGHSLDLGLFQINSANLGWLGLTVPAAFNPCRSAAAAAAVLTAFSRYNTGDATKGVVSGYAGAVVRAIDQVKAGDAAPIKAQLSSSHIRKPELRPPADSIFMAPALDSNGGQAINTSTHQATERKD
jgi:type IV secretion system protein VirB1